MVREPTEQFSLTLSGNNVTRPDTAIVNLHNTAHQFMTSSAMCMNAGSPASIYPSTLTVSGAPSQIGSMRVTLFGLQHNMPDNLEVLLVGPHGENMMLMAGAGGMTPMDEPQFITFTDLAGSVLPDDGPLTSGEFEPTTWRPNLPDLPAPAPPGPYNEPGSAIGGTGTQTLLGNFGQSNPNGVWRLYVMDTTGTVPQQTLNGCLQGWGLELLGPTAGNGSISGSVVTSDGRGIRNARVILTGDSLPGRLTSATRAFGQFSFENLQSGQTYVVTVNSRHYTFSTPSQVIAVDGNITGITFQADPEH